MLKKFVRKGKKKWINNGLTWHHLLFDDIVYHQFYIINISITLRCKFAKVNKSKQLQLHEKSKTISLGRNRCIHKIADISKIPCKIFFFCHVPKANKILIKFIKFQVSTISYSKIIIFFISGGKIRSPGPDTVIFNLAIGVICSTRVIIYVYSIFCSKFRWLIWCIV